MIANLPRWFKTNRAQTLYARISWYTERGRKSIAYGH